MELDKVFWVSVGAVIGANARYFLGAWAAERLGTTFPYGTLIINLTGSLILGFFLALATERALIDRCFAGASVEDILARLDQAATNSPFAAKCAATIRTKSPTSLKIAFEQMRRGRDMTFDEAMATEFRIVSRIARGRDFYEGVRAVIIDKDNAPRWTPPTLDAVAPSLIDAHFASLGADEWRAS